MAASSDDSVIDLLEQTNMRKYFVLFGPGNHNHMAHGIIALYRLGASKHRMQHFIEWYKDSLEEPKPDAPGTETQDVEKLRGSKTAYYTLLRHYENLLVTKYKTIDAVLAAEFPKLENGMFAAMFHGLIQTGYGYSVGSVHTVLEGLAQIHNYHTPLKLTREPDRQFGTGYLKLTDLVDNIRAGETLNQYCGIAKGTHEKAKSVVVNSQELFSTSADRLATFACLLKPPINRERLEPRGVMELAEWLVDQTFLLYTRSTVKNDFFLLHCVTGSWSLLQIIPLIKDLEKAVEMIYHFTILLLAVFVMRGCPELEDELPTNQEIGDSTWDSIVKETISIKDESLPLFGEHVYMLVQVANDMRKLAAGDKKKNLLYACAARMVLDYQFSFDIHPDNKLANYSRLDTNYN